MQTESMFPPKCCLTEIPMKHVLAALDKKQRELYKAKAAEYALKPENRWYCPSPECRKWIPPSKLHRLRLLGAQCPRCETKICGYCRGMAHGAGIDCPDDFGLEATLAEAERHGWRRCYKCRALVELTAGCRHITCKCNAQFCYTCGAKWRTCACTEVDQQRRQTEIAERRNSHNTRSRQEEEEIARAISAIEEMERRETEERARENAIRERRQALQRVIDENERKRREHLERLEAEKRRLAETEASRKREEAIRTSINERLSRLQAALCKVQQLQQSHLISRHHAEATELDANAVKQQASHQAGWSGLQSKLDSNSMLRRNLLQSTQSATLAALTCRHEAEDDDTYLSLQARLRDKPNRDERIKSALERLQHRQQEELTTLTNEHATQMALLAANVAMERDALGLGHALGAEEHRERLAHATTLLHRTIGAERRWFEVVAERRSSLLAELAQRLWRGSGVSPNAVVGGGFGGDRGQVYHPAREKLTPDPEEHLVGVPGPSDYLNQKDA